MEQFTCQPAASTNYSSLASNPAAAVSFLARINVNVNNTPHSKKADISFIIINYHILPQSYCKRFM